MSVPEGLGLAAFNVLSDQDARQALSACCSSARWAETVAAGRPYDGADDLFSAAEAVLCELTGDDLDEALSGHPRIGEQAQGPDSAWSRREQRGVTRASAQTLAAMAAANRSYEERFGSVYLVCADGRTADELLAILEQRLGNSVETEREVVRGELAKINRIRLGRLLVTEAA